MSRRRWIRRAPGRSDNVRAAVIATGLAGFVGVGAFFLTRLLLARDEIEPLERARERSRNEDREQVGERASRRLPKSGRETSPEHG